MTPAQEQQLLDTVEFIKVDVNQLKTDVNQLKTEVRNSNDKFFNYQQATQWVVQLAFSLIASATIIVIVSNVLNKR